MRGRIGSAEVAVLTIIDEEFQAAQRILGVTVEKSYSSKTYWFQQDPGDPPDCQLVCLRTSGQGNFASQSFTSRLIEDFRPYFLILAGIAGGLKEVNLGDVVVANYIDYSEYGKLKGGAFLLRSNPHDHPSLFLHHETADPVKRANIWPRHILVARPEPGEPKLTVGNLVAGEKNWSDPDSPYQRDLLLLYEKSLAVDMESAGFARAVYEARSSRHYNPQAMVVRGISDMVQGRQVKKDKDATAVKPVDAKPKLELPQEMRDRWRAYAAEAALAATKAIIERLLVTAT